MYRGVCVWLLSHHSGALHGVADDHDDASSVVLQDSCCGTLQQLTVGAERRAEGDVDAARNMASAEAGDGGVKEQRCQLVQHLLKTTAKERGQYQVGLIISQIEFVLYCSSDWLPVQKKQM